MTMQGEFAMALVQIIWINILLSGDNAVVIALACRSLPPHQQKLGIILGTAPAVVLRIVFTVFIVYLLQVPLLKLIGGLLLLWIAYKLLVPDDEEHAVAGGNSLMEAIKTIVIADAVMSLDNVIAIAAAAKGDLILLVLGLSISIPLIVFGSTIVLKLIERFPMLVTVGAALLGFIAGEVIVSDPLLHDWLSHSHPTLYMAAPYFGAVGVVSVGLLAIRAMRVADGVVARAEAVTAEPEPALEVAYSAEEAR
ncbi:TerC family protein [Azospirillum sp. RWY-5-1]|uniref:TerC family protein n=1 Tax=Azospirillum oleiclasticum TaxID=2735135 RepID=A0ABX2TDS7_9PROT|nr:TerC family protein [Azospirillum oleiclasticum]NYZ14647.1 TerC family protein [Azospirillum oleiclasticum]NYZ22366.1 TerC family protein [Azospirillum oleiclasticum]